MLTGHEAAEKYPDLLVGGLSGPNRYVLLTKNPSKGAHVAFRVNVRRLNANTVLVGGYVRIGRNELFIDGNKAGRYQADDLREVYPGLTYPVADFRRARSEIGVAIAAARNDGEKIIEDFNSSGVVTGLMKTIEKTLGIEINERRKVKAILDAEVRAIFAHPGGVFAPPEESVKLPAKVVGTNSDVILLSEDGASEKLNAFVQEVTKKVAGRKKSKEGSK